MLLEPLHYVWLRGPAWKKGLVYALFIRPEQRPGDAISNGCFRQRFCIDATAGEGPG